MLGLVVEAAILSPPAVLCLVLILPPCPAGRRCGLVKVSKWSLLNLEEPALPHVSITYLILERQDFLGE